jgi:hypothetical protein
VNGESAYGGEMNELALFESALRAAVPTQPDPRLGVVLVPRLAEAARASTVEAETHAVRRGLRSRRGLVARVGIAVALVPLVLAGLAFAGVTVPQPARSVFHAVGITLPNQSAKHSHPSSPTTTGEQSSGEGNGTNQSQSTGNSQAAHQHAREQRAKAKGNAIGHTRGKAIGLNDLVPPGHSGQTGPPAQSNSGGNGNGNGNGVAKGHTRTSPAPTTTPPGHTKTPPGHSK